MKFDIESIKASTDIADVIGGYVKLKKNGAEYSACCPFHDEKTPSFSVIPNKDMYYCFGCGAGGDVIDFVMDFNQCSFVDACKILGGELKSDSFVPVTKQRKEITSYYDDYKPLKTKRRINAGDKITLINPKRDGKKWTDAQPTMVFPYLNADGSLHGYVLRFEIDDKKLTPMVRWCDGPQGKGWHNYPFDEPRPLYRADQLENEKLQVLVLEGEKATEAAIAAAGGKVACIGWSGGTNGYMKSDWSAVKGRKVILWPDNDEPGHKCVFGDPKSERPGLAKHLLDQGALSVHWIESPDDLPKGWDCADREWTTKEFLTFAKENKRDIIIDEEPPEMDGPPAEYYENHHHEEDQPEKPAAPEIDEDQAPYRILGHYGGKRFYMPESTKQLIALSPSEHSKNNLLALAPLHHWMAAGMDVTTKNGLDMAINALMQMSAGAGMFDSNRVRGRGAWIDDGRAVVHMGQQMLVDGLITHPHKIQSRYIYQQDIDLGVDLTEPLSNKQAFELVDICRQLSWENPLSATLLAGWCVIAPLTGILNWRPHVWVTGPSGSGKSTVINTIVKPMLGDFALLYEGKTTEAAIRQKLGLDARPVLYDEAEAEDKQSADRLKSIIDFSRICSSGGTVAKGSANGTSIEYTARAIFCFSSINTSIKHLADESRISQLVLKQDFSSGVDHYEKLKTRIMDTITAEYASSMLSRAFMHMQTLLDNTKIFSQAANIYFKSQRIADQIGVMLAGAYLCHSTNAITRDEALHWIKQHNWEDHTTVASAKDSERLLSHLLTRRIRVSDEHGHVDISLGEAIVNADDANSPIRIACNDELKRLGIKIELNRFVVANSSNPLSELLRDTPWVSSWPRTLKEFKGAEAVTNQYFAPGIKCRGVALPIELVTG